jgi:hypothetical protein
MKIKVIKYNPLIFSNCHGCPYHTVDLQTKHWFNTVENHFCTASFYTIKYAKQEKLPVLSLRGDKTNTCLYLENPNEIPISCPLDDYPGG